MKMALLKSVIAFATVIAGLFADGLVAAQDEATEPDGLVQFLHASPDAPEVDVYVGGAPIAQDLAYGVVTEYTPLSPSQHHIQVVPSGEDVSAALLDSNLDVESGAAYTVAIANRLNEIEIQSFESNLDDLENDGQSRVRVVSLAPDAGEIDLYEAGGDEWFDGVDFGNASEHRDVDAGFYDFEVRPNDSDQVILTADNSEIESGREYSFYVIGLQENDSLQLLPLSVSVKATCSDSLGLEGQPDDTCVRIVHASLDSAAVDVYIEDALFVENLMPASFTDFEVLPEGEGRSIKIVATGGSLDDPLIDEQIDLDAASAYDIVLGGNAGDLKIASARIDLSPVPVSQARLRLVHFSPDTDNIDIVVTDGPALFEDVGFEEVSDNIVVDANTYDIQVRRSGEVDVYLRATDFTVAEGTFYEIITIGNPDDGTFALLILEAPVELREGDAGELAESGTPGVESEEATSLEEGTPTPVAESDPISPEASPSPSN